MPILYTTASVEAMGKNTEIYAKMRRFFAFYRESLRRLHRREKITTVIAASDTAAT